MKTFSATPADIQKKWVLIDAEGLVLGRLAAVVADRLRGKHKPSFTPHMDCGDNVIVINADKVQITGRKREDSRFYWHTGFPGGIKERSPREFIDSGRGAHVIENAVRRMVPRGPLGRQQMSNLRVYADAQHKQEAQQPEKLDVGAMNGKNTRNG